MSPSKAEFILGIEGGGTALSGCLLRGDGVMVAYAQAEPVVYAQVRGGISEPILQLLRRLQQQAQVPPQTVDYAGVCSTGIGRAADRKIVTEALAAAGLARHLTVDSDAMSALTGAFAGSPGIIVGAGTGSFAFARAENGELVRVGGWGIGTAAARPRVSAACSNGILKSRASSWSSARFINPALIAATWQSWRRWFLPKPRPATRWRNA
ncbi:hypothetical protein HUU39_27020 [candidate division KSB1 bacterium]|nr:hypothetical protein [candidate division KSB1 bacterium]